MLKTSFARRRVCANSSNFIQRLRKFARSTGGNVAIMFGVCFVPIVLSAGVAVDLSRALIVRERLGHALDAAALAVGGSNGLTEQMKQDMADDFFAANYPVAEIGIPGAVTVTSGEDTVYLTASADVPTTLMAIFNYQSLTVNADTEVTLDTQGIEVVLVLDNTGSMSGSKIESLKNASEDLVEILFGPEETSDMTKIGLVPFTAAVNIGTDSLADDWIDDSAASTLAGHAFQPGVNVLDLYDQIPNAEWDGCIETRLPPYDVTDDAPNTGDPDTLWLPYFAPDEPDLPEYVNNYLVDQFVGTPDDTQRFVGKYDGTAASGNGPLRGCTVPPLTPLTNVKQDLLDAIDAMVSSGYTHIPIGAVWGWRVLSPTEPYTEGAEYDDKDWQKAIIIMTDGANTIDAEPNHNGSNYSAYGFMEEQRISAASQSDFVDQLNTNLTAVCDNIKAETVRVYTITFEVSNQEIIGLMKSCASGEALYFNSPSEEHLEATFQAIAMDLSRLRISM